MYLNKENKEQYHLLKKRTDLADDVLKAIDYADIFAESCESYFINSKMDFHDACEKSYYVLRHLVKKETGQDFHLNSIIPILYKFWLYNEEFEWWLRDYDDDSELLINI
jgi:uncharacterized protein YqkB